MKTLSELCEELGINEKEVLQLYSITFDLQKRGKITDVERLCTSIYAILRRDGKLNKEIVGEIKKYVNKTLLKRLNTFCEKCLDFRASMKKFVLENFNLTNEQKIVFEKEYETLLEQFKNKTLTLSACATLAYIALQKANMFVKVNEFAKKLGITPTAMRHWCRKLLKSKLKILKKCEVKYGNR